jgi:hypothetical protein
MFSYALCFSYAFLVLFLCFSLLFSSFLRVRNQRKEGEQQRKAKEKKTPPLLKKGHPAEIKIKGGRRGGGFLFSAFLCFSHSLLIHFLFFSYTYLIFSCVFLSFLTGRNGKKTKRKPEENRTKSGNRKTEKKIKEEKPKRKEKRKEKEKKKSAVLLQMPR